MTDAADRVYEQVLVLRCQAGDDGAFAEIVERYHARLGYYLRRMLSDDALADDVLQNVWLAVFRQLPRLEHPRALSVWLYRIARNAALAELRKAPDWVELGTEPLAPDTERGEPDFCVEDAARIHAALDRLRPEHKEVLTLRFLEEMSYEQIAEIVRCPLGTVRSRIHYAKRALREQMEG